MKLLKFIKENRTSYTRRGRERRYEVFVATVTYNTLDGATYKCRSKGDKDNSDYRVGQKTKVHYNKINPANSRLEEDEKNRSLAFLVGSAFGLFFIILPIITIIKRRPFNKTEWEKRRLPVN
ncbi:MAG: DUF3592 domain-containing protein [Chitinophagaceae bacterium]|nr:DUF3592 domain-containing protein [Chitinophagaceae bacterium]